MNTHVPLTFIGAGNMAASLIGGLVAQGYPASLICASDPNDSSREQIHERFQVRTEAENGPAVSNAAVVVLAVKPQVMEVVAAALKPHLAHRPLIISIAAGITVDSLKHWLGDNLPIVRCMPNTPSLLQEGATGLYASELVSDEQKIQTQTILSAVGRAWWVEKETDIDAVTAVSGSGPAYFFLLMEAMQMAGEKLGLDAELSRDLTLQTALGAAKMALEGSVDPAELRRRVTSPGGTTEQAINTFEQGGLRQLVDKALKSAAQRSTELADELGHKP